MKGSLENGDWISWSAYHAHIQQAVIPPAALNSLLPLFLDNAYSVAMIKHSTEVINAAVQHLNPGQVTVIAADQRGQANTVDMAKYTRRRLPFRKQMPSLFVIQLLGNWVEDSGWTSDLTQAKIASSGTADSFISASHVTKTRHAHQVTA